MTTHHQDAPRHAVPRQISPFERLMWTIAFIALGSCLGVFAAAEVIVKLNESYPALAYSVSHLG